MFYEGGYYCCNVSIDFSRPIQAATSNQTRVWYSGKVMHNLAAYDFNDIDRSAVRIQSQLRQNICPDKGTIRIEFICIIFICDRNCTFNIYMWNCSHYSRFTWPTVDSFKMKPKKICFSCFYGTDGRRRNSDHKKKEKIKRVQNADRKAKKNDRKM